MDLMKNWEKLRVLPWGKRAFSLVLRRAVPYADSIRPLVLELEPGKVIVKINERRRIRNHLRSIHAAALMNLGELASGLAVVSCLPPGAEGIVTEIRIRYLKKARGTIRARGFFQPPADFVHVAQESTQESRAELLNSQGEKVAELHAFWKIRRRSSVPSGVPCPTDT